MIRNGTFDSMSYDEDDTPTESFPPVSPAGGAESLFLAGLATQNISAQRLSTKIREAHARSVSDSERSNSGASLWSVLTDDFQSCAEYSQDDDLLLNTVDSIDENDDNSALTSFYSVQTRKSVPQETIIEEPSDSEMPSNKMTVPAPVAAPPAPPAEDSPDVAEHVYEHAKGIWAWGKGIPIVSFGLGLTEAVVGKAVSVVGTDLENIDSNIIKPNLANLDGAVLNPAISTIVGVVLGAAGKTEEVFKPIVISILSPFGLIKNEAENP